MRHLVYFFSIFLLQCFFQRTDAQSVDFLNQINSSIDFRILSGEPLVSKYTNINSVKVLVRKSNNEVYFINSKNYKLHFEFVNLYLKESADLEEFNANNYSDSKQRKYYLPNLNYDGVSNRFFIDFSAADNISIDNVCLVHRAIQQNLKLTDSLYILLSNPKLLSSAEYLKVKGIPVISPREIYLEQKLQIISQGVSCGKLIRFKTSEDAKSNDYSSNILIVEGNTNDIPLCRGIISLSLQTPLSHICILSRKRGTPAIAFPDYKSGSISPGLENTEVCFIVQNDSFRIIPFNESIQADFEPKKKKEIILKIDTLTRSILDLKEINAQDVKTVGAKAANLGEITKIKKFAANLPEGACAIPIAFYCDHIKKSGADSLINKLDNPLLSHEERVQILSDIRKKIQKTPIDKALLDSIEYKLRSYNLGNNFRFRSSSNAEDREFFSGAGLYDSKTVVLGDSIKTIEKAIKKVWTSLWSLRACEERKFSNIDNQTVGMGILVHRSFPAEKANGVIITRNLYRDVPYGFIFNVQAGDVSVVQPDDSVQCDQFISYYNLGTTMFNKPNSTEYLTFSSINNEIPVLTDEQIKFLTQQAELIKQHFYYRRDNWKTKEYKDFALDIEFKVDTDISGNLKIYIKQVRPF